MNKKEVSVILCIYNAGEVLVDTIKHLTGLCTEGIENMEIIFVDNKSTDDSCDIIKNSLQDFTRISWKIVTEENSGLTYARLKGIQEAKYDILLFCDQDNLLFENYLTRGMEILEKDPKIAVLGGLGIARSERELPEWFGENKAFYAVGEQMPQSGQIMEGHFAVYGAGMFVRKSAFEDITQKRFKFFNTSRSGKKLASGEDTEMCMAFHIAGYKIWYDEDLKFFHVIDTNKLSLKYLEKLKMGISCSRYVTRFYLDYICGYVPEVTNLFWLKELVYSLKDLLFSLFKRDNKLGMKRNYHFSMYLLKQRSLYNENVKNILSICRSLDNKCSQ